ncbi:hypothetical protein [Effusibacillus dendaii]|nr:hypothetical protein [Effusibacillus dendaii]
MRQIRFFMKQEKGSPSIEFLGAVLLIMLIVFNIYGPIKYIYQMFTIEHVHRLALLQMEQEGGFSDSLKTSIERKLEAWGLDSRKAQITSDTPAPTQWGDPIDLTIRYQTDYDTYGLKALAFQSARDEQVIQVTRSSISRVYFK